MARKLADTLTVSLTLADAHRLVDALHISCLSLMAQRDRLRSFATNDMGVVGSETQAALTEIARQIDETFDLSDLLLDMIDARTATRR